MKPASTGLFTANLGSGGSASDSMDVDGRVGSGGAGAGSTYFSCLILILGAGAPSTPSEMTFSLSELQTLSRSSGTRNVRFFASL